MLAAGARNDETDRRNNKSSNRSHTRGSRRCPAGTQGVASLRPQWRIVPPPSLTGHPVSGQCGLYSPVTADSVLQSLRTLLSGHCGLCSPVTADFVLRSLRDPLPPGQNDSTCQLSAKGYGSLPFF